GHRNEHDFPEQKEEEEVEREEDANDADFEEQKRHEEFFHAFLNAFPGSQNGDQSEEGGENDQEEADAIDADVVADRRARDPSEIFFELIALLVDRDFEEQHQRKRELGHGDGKGDFANPGMVVAAQQQQRQRAEGREED